MSDQGKVMYELDAELLGRMCLKWSVGLDEPSINGAEVEALIRKLDSLASGDVKPHGEGP